MAAMRVSRSRMATFLDSSIRLSSLRSSSSVATSTFVSVHAIDDAPRLRPPQRQRTADLARSLRVPMKSSALRFHSTKIKDEEGGLHPHISGYDLDHPDCNVPPHIAQRVGINLHLHPEYHPLCAIKRRIQEYFDDFSHFDDLSPVVPTKNNFDLLRIPPDHVSRSRSDTYYLNNDTVLRTHTSAHQVELLSQGHTKFTMTGDVYRRDEIDSSHYPIFHQMEGVRVVEDVPDGLSDEEARDYVMEQLKDTLAGLARSLFGTDIEIRWVDAYFPFTHPSVELEIWYGGEWLEVLGCGVVQPSILEASGSPYRHAWAFGLGLERLAMVLHNVPDIRLFWSTDPRFSEQFANVKDDSSPVQFQPYSKYPPCFKDISFWLPDEKLKVVDSGEVKALFHVNDLNEVIRQVAGDLVEQVTLVDSFRHPKTHRISHCYRITFRSMDRSLTNAEIDELQWKVRDLCVNNLGVELR